MGFERVFIIGFGQMGKSIANTLKQNHFKGKIFASSRNKVENYSFIDGVFDIKDIAKNDYDNSIIFVCTPPNTTNAMLEQIFAITKKYHNCIITDICSIKQQISKHKNNKFISIHQMDGGNSYTNNKFYFKKTTLNYIINDNLKLVDDDLLYNYKKFLSIFLNCKNEEISIKEHDKIVAFTSHLQNLILTSYYNDFSKIDSQMWREIFSQNSKNIKYFIKNFQKILKNEIKTSKNLENAIIKTNKQILNSEKIDIKPKLFNPSLKNVFGLKNNKKIENKIKKEEKYDIFLQNMNNFFEKLAKRD